MSSDPETDAERRFTPTVHVISNAPDTRTPPDLRFDAMLERFPGLAAADAVCLTGSVAAGWGNALSDLDVFVFSADTIDLPRDESAETWPSTDQGRTWTNWMGRYGDTLVDIQVWSPDALEVVLAPYLDGSSPELCKLSDEEQKFVWRMSVANSLKNPNYFQDALALIRRSSYPAALARSLKVYTELHLTDVGGQLTSGDSTTARLTSMLAAEAAADHCLVLAGELCRSRKWLLRRLASTPSCGITVDEYLSVVLGGRRPGESDEACALRISRWAQSQLARVEEQALIGR